MDLVGYQHLEPIQTNFSYDDFEKTEDVDKPRFVLKKVFGFDDFRPAQKEIIDSILSGADNIALLPTGGGKSIIYTIAAIIQGGVHLVVEPLKSLMEEQVRNLRAKNITAYFIHGTVPGHQIDEIINILTNVSTKYCLLFTSPEKLQLPKIRRCLENLKRQNRLINSFIDEAHCVELWGGSFRQNYSELGFLKTEFGIPVTALSGSATDRTVSFIKKTLHMEEPLVTKKSFARNNVTISIVKQSTKPVTQIVNLIKTNFPDTCGIVYCNKRGTTKDIAHALKCEGITCTFIHGGLDDTEKCQNEQKWNDGLASVACCTKSFAMGIDKSNVRFVYHIDMPESFEDYYQEVGRAGRDGQPAVALSLSSIDDRNFHLQKISCVTSHEERQFKLENLYKITNYFTQTTQCRHKLVLEHFGEDNMSCEDNCDVCCGQVRRNNDDHLTQAKEIMKCFTSVQKIHNKVTFSLFILIIMGSNSQEIRLKGLNHADNFGVGKTLDCPVKRERKLFIQKLVLQMISKGFLHEVFRMKQQQAEGQSFKGNFYLELGNLGEFYKLDSFSLP